MNAGMSAGINAGGTSRLWALKAIAILSPWPLHAFWREYLHVLLCAFPPNATTPFERRILQDRLLQDLDAVGAAA